MFLAAQEMPYINYTTHNGLPQIQVQFLFQDSKGYIWAGTKGGLARFNGEKFETFLKNEYIYKIDETVNGQLLVSSREGIYQFEKGKMKKIVAVNEPTSFIAGKDSYFIFNKHSIKEIRNDSVVLSLNSDFNISHFTYLNFFDRQENIPFFLSFIDSQKIYYIKQQKINSLTFEGYVQLRKFENGKVYVLLNDKDLFKAIDPFTKKEFFHFEYENGEIQNLKIIELPVEKHLFDYFPFHVLLDNHTKTAKSLEFNYVKQAFDVLIDVDDNYWLATDNGLFQVSNGAIQMFSKDYMNDVWTLNKGNDGYFYAGEYQKGLYKMNFDKHTKSGILIPGIHHKPEIDFYYGSSKDALGNLYFPTQNGVIKYDYKTFTRLDHESVSIPNMIMFPTVL